MHRRAGSLKPPLAGALVLLIIVAVAGYVVHERAALPSRIELSPAQSSVFAGSSLALRATLVGGTGTVPVRWSVVGPGSVSDAGVYAARGKPGESTIVVARAGDVSASAHVQIVAPPDAAVPLLLVACYEGEALDVRDLGSLRRIGTLGAPESAAGISVDPARRVALVAAKETVMAVDLTTMASARARSQRGARFSGAALLAGGYFAVTENNAASGAPGVYVFRIAADGTPTLAATAPSGETPEGIVAEPDGRTFYVTNVNSNEVIRYSFDGRGAAHITGRVATGNRPYGIALDSRRKLLFVTDNDTPYLSGAHSRPGLEVISLPSLRRLGAPLATGSKDALPIGAAADAALGRLFVTNEGDADVIAYDLPSLRRLGALSAGKYPWTPRVDEHAARLYVPNAHDDTVDVFDTRTLARVAPPVATCAYPTNLAVAPRRTL